ncbi:hypothetical protein POTOM_025412 [Populus tomentosa]|uniref:Ankyrin repeat family protein n=1 Tax=Populus tomentosa TaxID=118781 RepID=A0A8X7ZIK6_POPTO|nr:hypothetical protein POTOM_025412 [Populus tomentosa]
MAVHLDNLMEEEENEEDNALFEGDGLVDQDSDIPPHLLDLARAAQLGDLDALRNALDNLNGSIDEPVEDGDTALHLTCLYGYLPCVQLLLERGANLEAKDEDGAIPLHDACAGGFTEIAQLLLNTASSAERVKRMLEAVDDEGDTVSCNNKLNGFRVLVGGRILRADWKLPLHHAARGEHADVIRLLLASGASATTANSYGKIPSELPEPDTEAHRILESAGSASS